MEAEPSNADPPKRKRRWYQFSLRTLLIVVGFAAVASWSNWIGWPWFKAFLEQHRFETAVKQLRAGDSVNSELALKLNAGANPSLGYDQQGNLTGLSHYFLTNAAYFIVYRFPKGTGNFFQRPCSSVQVYRLPPVPVDYLKHREVHSMFYPDRNSEGLLPPETTERAYMLDVRRYLTHGNSLANYGIKCELIYSDPPAKPEGK
jgi:hypothetical protein